jgi:hypothetical protein
MPYVSERSHTLLSIEDKPENTGGQNFSSSKPSVLALKQSPFIFLIKKVCYSSTSITKVWHSYLIFNNDLLYIIAV